MKDLTYDQDKFLAIAKLLGPWGVKGHIKCMPYNPETEIFLEVEAIFFHQEKFEKLSIEQAKPHGKYWLLKLRGYETPEAVQSLRNQEIYVPRSVLPELQPGEIYLNDLLGFEVFSFKNEKIGTVKGFQRVGDSDVILVGEAKSQVEWIPYRKEFVEQTSLDKKQIYLSELALQLF